MRTISLHPNDNTVLKKQTKSSEHYWIMKYCSFLDSLLCKNLFARNTLFWKQKHHFETHAHNKCHVLGTKSIYWKQNNVCNVSEWGYEREVSLDIKGMEWKILCPVIKINKNFYYQKTVRTNSFKFASIFFWAGNYLT